MVRLSLGLSSEAVHSWYRQRIEHVLAHSSSSACLRRNSGCFSLGTSLFRRAHVVVLRRNFDHSWTVVTAAPVPSNVTSAKGSPSSCEHPQICRGELERLFGRLAVWLLGAQDPQPLDLRLHDALEAV